MTPSRSQRRAGLALLLASALPTAAHAEGWDWSFAPYAWFPDISADFGNDAGSGSIDSSFFPNVVDKIDGAFLGHVEGRGDHIGLFTDLVFLSLGDSRDFAIASTESDLDATIFELAVVYGFGERFEGFDVFGGLRYIDVGFDIDVDPTNPELPSVRFDGGRSASDFLFGARYTARFAERWGVTLRGDGSAGETEGTWSASAIFQYHMSNGAWVLGYRYMDLEFQPRNAEVDMSLSGPIVGYNFRF